MPPVVQHRDACQARLQNAERIHELLDLAQAL